MKATNPFDKKTFLKDAVEIFNPFFDKVHSCLILAPHPDDESLGCGGLIALLCAKKIRVYVVVTTDGSQSHPNSKAFTTTRLAELRKKEVKNALKVLGLEEDNIYFLEGKDSALPYKDEEGFDLLVAKLAEIFAMIVPQLVLVPYELDPHRDHRATWQILNSVIKDDSTAKVWEYLIWLYELAEASDIPHLKNGELKKLNVEPFLALKEKAIHSHVSQTTRLIHDDLTGFMLMPEVIRHFTTKFEYFLDRR